MRSLWKDILVAVWLGMILPGMVLNAVVLKGRVGRIQQTSAVREEIEEDDSCMIALRDSEGICVEMEMDAYLTGVLLAEIPTKFHGEALKAQSVAARTYTWKAYTTGGKHGDGSVCTDSACCQAYMSEDTYLSSGGSQEDLEKVRRSVNSTSSMVLLYEGELIEATYFSSSGGKTEAAVAVWGADFPYLQAVFSPEEASVETVFYTKKEFEKLLGTHLAGETIQWFGPVIHTDGGGVASMEICGEDYTGVQLRALLGLRSTAFEIQTEGGKIKITTKGYGHRVGMSQYGANAMAEQGSTWQQILQHYYPGTTISPIV